MEDLKESSIPRGKRLTLPSLPARYIDLTWLEDGNQDELCTWGQNNAPLPFAISNLVQGEILSAIRLADGPHVKTTLGIEIKIEGEIPDYLPGDTIGILPKNSEAEANKILRHLELWEMRNKPCKLSIISKNTKKISVLPAYLPTQTTPKHLLESCLEIRAPVKKLFLRSLIEYTLDKNEREGLEEMCCSKGKIEICNLMELFDNFPSCRPPLSLLLEHLPRLHARPYSIASSPLDCKDTILIVLNIMEEEMKKGVCSGWLENITLPFTDLSVKMNNLRVNGSLDKIKVPLYFRKTSSFRLPTDPSVPLLMIAHGTGLAPFVGFLRHRRKEYKDTECSRAENWLFFGCRFKERDFIFKEELNSFLNDKTLTKLYTSFSRDCEHTCESSVVYVQDFIKLNEENFLKVLIDQSGYLCVCGRKEMISGVEQNVINAIKKIKGLGDEESTKIFKDIEKSGKYLKDVWY